ncbi:MAG: 5-nitroimidazole antibiotic resistance protein [Clostridiales bacterium]|nr:5-nitroimidazole antibiotic resistance protein [Clostridiales bacterium]
MFREMRRNRQALSTPETLDILKNGTSGTLAVLGDDGYPYAVPMSYVNTENAIFFHCAGSGHKLDAVRNYEKASFCVVAQDVIVPEKYTTHFRSAIAFGRMRILEDSQKKREALLMLAEKYNPGHADAHHAEIEPALARTTILCLDIEHLTGKQAIELVRMREGK